MTRLQLSRRTRLFLLWTARLALVAYLVQLSAIDHWQHTHVGDVVGVQGSSAHVEHCHGAGDCSSGGGAVFAANVDPMTLPLPAAISIGADATAQRTPASPLSSPPGEPPQAA